MLAEPSEKLFSKTGVTGALMAGSGAMDMAESFLRHDAGFNWMSMIAMVGGLLVVAFRKYSDGKTPKVV